MNLPNRRAAKLILLGDLRVRVRVRVRISGENRTRTPTRTLPSLKLDAFALSPVTLAKMALGCVLSSSSHSAQDNQRTGKGVKAGCASLGLAGVGQGRRVNICL